MDTLGAKMDLMKRTQKGIAMFYIGSIFWLLMGVLSFFDMHINLLGLFHLIGIGMLFPLGIFSLESIED